MTAQGKYWVWSSVCLMVVMMAGINDAVAHDDATSYWERRLYGARMTPSVRAMVSPLSSRETAQFVLDISRGTASGQYSPVQAAAFCSAAHLQCALGGLQSEELGSPALHVREKVEVEKSPRLLTSASNSDVHELSGTVFREKEVLVSGIDIRENYGSYEGDNEVDKASGRAFLPRNLAKLFSLRGDGANIVKTLGASKEDVENNLQACKSGIDKSVEVKTCASSIEDVADFVGSILGASPTTGVVMYDSITNASHVSRHPAGDTFHILHVDTLTADSDPFIACHDMAFPFRVFICHSLKHSKAFQVTLRGENGSTHARIAVCHYDTSFLSPQDTTLQELHTKPGESEVCHWLGGRSLRQTGWVFVRRAAVV